jgi:hypothetical protein
VDAGCCNAGVLHAISVLNFALPRDGGGGKCCQHLLLCSSIVCCCRLILLPFVHMTEGGCGPQPGLSIPGISVP